MLPKSGIWFRHSSELFRALPAKKQSLGAGRLGQQIAIAENVSYRNGITDPHDEAVARRPGSPDGPNKQCPPQLRPFSLMARRGRRSYDWAGSRLGRGGNPACRGTTGAFEAWRAPARSWG